VKRSIVALLPMKAHSERVPEKNFRALGTRPLYRWMLDTLLTLDEISMVVINTDARAHLAARGTVDSDRVIIRDRHPEICGDDVSMNRVLADDVGSVPADLYLMTHTTNPFLRASTIRSAIERFTDESERNQADSLFTVNRIQTRFYRIDGTAVNHDPQRLVRTQDLEPWFEENSCLYLFTKNSFQKTQARIGEHPILWETPTLESIDIDTPSDWEHAERLVAGGMGSR
jgi:CMP-N-acetylneuraminic acid synthetase